MDELANMETRLTRQIESGFQGVHARMTRFEDEVRPALQRNGEEIAVLKDRSNRALDASEEATSAVLSSKRSTANRASTWGGLVAGAAIVGFEVLKAYFGGSK